MYSLKGKLTEEEFMAISCAGCGTWPDHHKRMPCAKDKSHMCPEFHRAHNKAKENGWIKQSPVEIAKNNFYSTNDVEDLRSMIDLLWDAVNYLEDKEKDNNE